MEKRSGGCHCKAVRYEVEIDLTEPVIECNCTHCQTKGFLLSFVPWDKFILLQGEDHLIEYRFNSEQIGHLFCKTCGVQAFAKGQGKDGATAAINVRSIDDIDLSLLTRMPFDGRSK